ncbi:MAG: polysaccharide biosynthesis/export family protein [Fuerstiella sp.]
MNWSAGLVLAFAVFCLSGCQTGNFYYAQSMPSSLRLVAQTNPQEVDLSRLASASGGSDTIGPGDILEVAISASLSKDDQVTIPVRIQDDGSAFVPDIGRVDLAGVEPQAAESLIRMEAMNRGLYRNPTVTVSFAHKKVNHVRVLGAVKEPGLYELPPNASDIVTAIAKAQGLAENAGEKVEVRNPVRPGQRSPRAVAGDPDSPYSAVSDSSADPSGMRAYTVSLTSASTATGNRYFVEDGGVVMVEKRDPAPIQVGGLVNKADTYDFPIGKTLTVLGAVQMAGGISNQLADKVYVIRPLAQEGQKARIQVSLRKAKRNPKEDIVLGPGDMVLVEQTPGTVLMEAMQLIRFGISGSTVLF